MNEWAIGHPWRLNPEFHFLACRLPWFDEINGVRTKLVHRGGAVGVYTERTRFGWGIHSPGQKLNRGRDLLLSRGELHAFTVGIFKRLAVVRPALPELEGCAIM